MEKAGDSGLPVLLSILWSEFKKLLSIIQFCYQFIPIIYGVLGAAPNKMDFVRQNPYLAEDWQTSPEI